MSKLNRIIKCDTAGYIGTKRAYPVLIKRFFLEYSGYNSTGVVHVSDSGNQEIHKGEDIG